MKRYIIFSVYLILNSVSFSQNGWVQQNCGVNKPISKIYFIDYNTGWFATNGAVTSASWGHFARTTNGGSNWNIILNNDIAFPSFCFINSSTGWLLGSYYDDIGNKNRLIYKTTNSGINWTTQLNDNAHTGLYNVFFIDQNYGWAVGSYSTAEVYRTTNSGINWYNQTINNVSSLYSVYFINQLTGWTVGGNHGNICMSTDGGITWLIQDTSSTITYQYVYFLNNSTGWAAGNMGIISKTTNSGTNWIKISLGSNFTSTSIYFPNSLNGFLVCYTSNSGPGYIYNSTNSGNSWSNQFTSSYLLNSIFFIDQNTGWAAGGVGTISTGIIYKTTNGGLSLIQKIQNNIPKTFLLFQNYPNPFNPTTEIKFSIPFLPLGKGEAEGVGVVTLKIFDILGCEVATLVNEKLSPGTYEVEWNGSNYASGVYFYKLQTRDASTPLSITKKLILLK